MEREMLNFRQFLSYLVNLHPIHEDSRFTFLLGKADFQTDEV
jgi:hypothetical protein